MKTFGFQVWNKGKVGAITPEQRAKMVAGLRARPAWNKGKKTGLVPSSVFKKGNTMKDFIEIMGIPTLMIVIIFMAMVGFMIIVDQKACIQISENTKHRTNWVFPTGCYIEIDNQNIPLNRWINNTGN